MAVIAVTVPYGVSPGMMMKAKTADGRAFMIPVPQGAKPGMTLMVTVPDPAPDAPPSSTPQALDPEDLGVDLVQSGTTMAEGVRKEDLKPCFAAICCICSLYPKFPDCLGAHVKGVLVCVEIESLCCKVGKADGSICMCMKNEIELIKPTTCVKMFQQFFCMDVRCAIPCDEDVPCIIAALGLTCVKNYKCICACGEALTGPAEEKEGGAAPAPDCEMMER